MERHVKKGKEYIPRWFPWFLLPILIPLMVWIGYISIVELQNLYVASGIIASLVIGVALIFFVSYKKMPIG